MLTLVIVTQAFGHTVQACQESSRHHSYGITSFQSHGADLSESQALCICPDTTGKDDDDGDDNDNGNDAVDDSEGAEDGMTNTGSFSLTAMAILAVCS